MDVLQPGELLSGRYKLHQKLGHGGFGAVWSAEDLAMPSNPPVAVKVLLPQLHENRRLVDRFTNEAEVLLDLHHPNIVRAYDFFSDKDRLCLVLELLDGEELTALLSTKSQQKHILDVDLIRDVFEQLCQGVAAAHEVGVLHRDLKPQNIMLLNAQADSLLLKQVKILDFGLAKLLDGEQSDATTIGRRFGSYMYMSPEQVAGTHTDQRADIFSLGCILFELLTARRTWARDPNTREATPFDRPIRKNEQNSPPQIFNRIMNAPRPVPSQYRSGLPTALDELVAAALSVSKEARPATVTELLGAFHEAVVQWMPTIADARPLDRPDTYNLADARLPLLGDAAPPPLTTQAKPAVLTLADPAAQPAAQPASHISAAPTAPLRAPQTVSASLDVVPLVTPNQSSRSTAWLLVGAALMLLALGFVLGKVSSPNKPPQVASPKVNPAPPKPSVSVSVSPPRSPPRSVVNAPEPPRAIRPARKRVERRPARPSRPAPTELQKLKAQLRQGKLSAAQMERIGHRLELLAQAQTTRSVQKRVERLVKSSLFAGDVNGLLQAAKLLE